VYVIVLYKSTFTYCLTVCMELITAAAAAAATTTTTTTTTTTYVIS